MRDFQEENYEQLKREKKNITLVLKSGVRIPGQIVGLDRFTVLMIVNGKQQLIYKQAISTIAM
ncbi:RNA chaperone Hfq [Bacillus cereus]|uniref:Fe-S cluster assembly protein HesB n=1 Tax=Bacillus bombysepticus str. Wang TaxID=1330043 RepID=A0A9W3PU47_9BACI|nr:MULTISPECIES: RNA chaperone Hfq [Bacillus cereus group]AHX21805.1 Fe-S cluster assembly protein HesB [Bacillus bombysepticus str. Wang]EJR83482.1 RNA chaperone Hfq [Bacillus cereus VD169]MCE9754357.1 RNA chaperone Hfq [Bacillus cereus]MCU5026248.1 RNA chaperone Hfq [Bacillus cereus]MDA2191551.1 RNA chaperone Hfq [Bacillus cereus]